MQFYEYKGCIIYPIPQASEGSNEWEAVFSIRKGKYLKMFITENLFNTEGEAAFHSISLGKKIIDGKNEEYTLDGMQ